MTRRPWSRTSASQHRAFLRCQRYWYFGWIDRAPRVTTVGQARGKKIHAGSEHYLKTGEVKDQPDPEGDYRRYVEALVPHLPPPKHPELIIEQRIVLPTALGEASWLGFIDIGFAGGEVPLVQDIKSTSDWRYNKTPDELAHDIQLISYGRWVYEIAGHRGDLELGHLYVKTGKKVPKKPRVRAVSAIVTERHVSDIWGDAQGTVLEMRKAACAESAHDLPPTVTACGMYGGCPFRKAAGSRLVTCSPRLERRKRRTV